MSYRIEYGTAVPAKYLKKKRKSHFRIFNALCILLFAFGTGRVWPEGREKLQNFLLPGEPSVTEQAFTGMISDLSEGVNLEEAMLVFCQQIIDHGTGEVD